MAPSSSEPVTCAKLTEVNSRLPHRSNARIEVTKIVLCSFGLSVVASRALKEKRAAPARRRRSGTNQ